MKLNFIDENLELELRFTSLAVEKIEDQFDATIDEIFSNMQKLRAKTVNFMMWALSGSLLDLEEFKVVLSKYYGYDDCIKMLTVVLTPPNATSPENADIETT